MTRLEMVVVTTNPTLQVGTLGGGIAEGPCPRSWSQGMGRGRVDLQHRRQSPALGHYFIFLFNWEVHEILSFLKREDGFF